MDEVGGGAAWDEIAVIGIPYDEASRAGFTFETGWIDFDQFFTAEVANQ